MSPNKVDANNKGRRKTLPLDIKMNILRRLDAGEKICEISASMNLARSTIQTVRNHKEKITASLESAGSSATAITRNRSMIMIKMESSLETWIEDNVHRRRTLSQLAIREKAKSIFDRLKASDPDYLNVQFDASSGWFERFKKRHNLQYVRIKGGASNKAWMNVGPECITAETDDLNEMQDDFVDAEKTAGLSDLARQDVDELITDDKDPLFIKELLEIDEEVNIGEQKSEASKLRVDDLKKAVKSIEMALADIEIADPISERVSQVRSKVNLALLPYKDI